MNITTDADALVGPDAGQLLDEAQLAAAAFLARYQGRPRRPGGAPRNGLPGE